MVNIQSLKRAGYFLVAYGDICTIIRPNNGDAGRLVRVLVPSIVEFREGGLPSILYGWIQIPPG